MPESGSCYNEGMADLFALIELLLKILNEPWIVILAVAFFYFLLQKDIRHIKRDLSNHITETNDKLDKQTARIDKLSDRIDRLYELLLKSKNGGGDKRD